MAKAGRPTEKDPKENVPLRLRGSLRKKVERIAKAEDRSLSYMLERAIEQVYS
jgi:predicted transcriptional regulator